MWQKFSFITDNYTIEIAAVILYLAIGFFVVWVSSIVRKYIVSLKVEKVLLAFLHYVVTAGQILVILLAVRVALPVFWERQEKTFEGRMKAWEGFNLFKKEPLDFAARVLPATDWVKESRLIYFISDKSLMSIKTNGSQKKEVFKADSAIREYHFSPDGKHLLIVTDLQLYLYDFSSQKGQLLEGVVPSDAQGSEKVSTVIDGISWSPDSTKFCYRIARWSAISSIDQWNIYSIGDQKRQPLQGLVSRIPALRWDMRGENLFYATFSPASTIYIDPFDAHIYKVPLETLKSEFLFNLSSQEPEIPQDLMQEQGIALFPQQDFNSYGRTFKTRLAWESLQGNRIGIDKYDHLYFIDKSWLWRKRLYRIPRIPKEDDLDPYKFHRKDYVIRHLHWLPKGRYVIMEHYFFGILILEPLSGKIGILDNERGNTFGFYLDANQLPKKDVL